MSKGKSSGEESRSKPEGSPGRNSHGNTHKKMGTFNKKGPAKTEPFVSIQTVICLF
jgi:hypothetical protein